VFSSSSAPGCDAPTPGRLGTPSHPVCSTPAEDQPPRLTVASRWRITLGAGIFVVFGVLLATSPKVGTGGRVVGGSSALFFGACGVAGLILGGVPPLEIDDDGIAVNRFGHRVGLLTWDNIAAVRIRRFVGQRFLTIDAIDPGRIYLSGKASRWAGLNRALRLGHVSIPSSMSASPLSTLQAEVCRRAGVTAPSEPRRRGRPLLVPLLAGSDGVRALAGGLAGRPAPALRLLAGVILVGGAWSARARHRHAGLAVVIGESVLAVLFLTRTGFSISSRAMALFLPFCTAFLATTRLEDD
jgi:hypothetical protein